MKITYQVFETINGVDHGGVQYKQLKRARDSARQYSLNQLARRVWILGFDELGEPTGFKEVIKDSGSQEAMNVLNGFFGSLMSQKK